MTRLLTVLIAVAALGIPAPLAVAQEARPAAERVESAVVSWADKGIEFSAAVWDAAEGDLVYGHAERVPRRPASVMKLATSAAAVWTLGPDHELSTEVFVSSAPDADGVVNGELFVRGGGDPGLSGRFADGDVEAPLRALARQVAEAGVRRVTGDLVLDDNMFSGPRRHPSWGHALGNYEWWMAPVSALVLNDNCIDVSVHPGDVVGQRARVEAAPATSAVTFLNQLPTVQAKSRHLVHFGRPDDEGRVPITGAVWSGSTGYSVSVACVEPMHFFGDVFRRLLSDAGVEVAGSLVLQPRGTATGKAAGHVEVARHGTPVSRVVRVCNRNSQNLFAELLLRAVGVASGEPGSFEGGAAAVRRALEFAPGDPSFVQVDGSGLSRDNRATPQAVGRILLRVYGSEHRLEFMKSLAKPGDESGTLRDRFEDPKFKDRLLAKTGTLRDTSALAGFARDVDSHVYVFVILCEGNVALSRRMQEALVSALVGP